MTPGSLLRGSRDCGHLVLENILLARAVQLDFFKRANDFEQHQLRWFVHTGPQIDGHATEIRHFKRNPSLKARIDLWRCYMNCHANTRPTAPPFNETNKIRRYPNTLERLSQNKLSWFQPVSIDLLMIPEIT